MFNFRVKLSLPADQRALVAGRLLDETLPEGNNGRYRATFEFAQLTDGIDLMAGPWRVREKLLPKDAKTGTPALRLRTYFPADLDAETGLAEAYLEDSRRYIERYSSEIGAYPYSEFSVVASPLPTGFGMPTLTYLGAEVLRLPFIPQDLARPRNPAQLVGQRRLCDYRRKATGAKA
jgi:aminopeptidase N